MQTLEYEHGTNHFYIWNYTVVSNSWSLVHTTLHYYIGDQYTTIINSRGCYGLHKRRGIAVYAMQNGSSEEEKTY